MMCNPQDLDVLKEMPAEQLLLLIKNNIKNNTLVEHHSAVGSGALVEQVS